MSVILNTVRKRLGDGRVPRQALLHAEHALVSAVLRDSLGLLYAEAETQRQSVRAVGLLTRVNRTQMQAAKGIVGWLDELWERSPTKAILVKFRVPGPARSRSS